MQNIEVASNLAVEAALSSPNNLEENDPAWDTTQQHLDETTRRVGQLASYLASAGWLLEGWVE